MKRPLTAVLLGAALALSGCATYQGTPASTPAVEPTVRADPTPADCATLPTGRDEPDSLDSAITRISLCNDPGHAEPYGFMGPTPPPDALVRDTGAVAAAYNALEVPRLEVMTCPADLGPAYRLVVEYGDGSSVQVAGELFGCRIVGNRMGANTVLDAFAAALRAQRAVVAPPTRDADPNDVCRSPWSWLTPELEDTTRGVLCTGSGTAAEGRELAAEDWRTVLADIAANANRAAPEDFPSDCAQTQPSTLVGVTLAGETRALQRTCDFFTWQAGEGPRPFDDHEMGWAPGERAKEILG